MKIEARPSRRAVGAVMAIVCLAGCGNQTATSDASSSQPPHPQGSRAAASLSPAPPNSESDGEVQPGQHEPAVWSDSARQAAVDHAAATVRAFARPDLSPSVWFGNLSPLLTVDAAAEYSYTDPQSIPVTTVTGGGRITDDTSAYVAIVSVPTSGGAYAVTVVRTDGSSPWLTSRITPPAGVR